jgi:LysR family transcriptional regulator, transcriptional activator of the cysJI operon
MHIETLKIFCDLVETQSFSLAAERNFVTQSAVSQQVRNLEEKFKRRLLERVRGRREVKLTNAGEVFYQECRNVLASFDQLQDSMRGLSGTVSGVVRVATVYSIGLHELPSKVREFMTRYPSAKIDLEYSRTTRVVRDVQQGLVEIGVVAYPEPRRGITIVPMPGDRLVLICQPEHELAKREEVEAVELNGRHSDAQSHR